MTAAPTGGLRAPSTSPRRPATSARAIARPAGAQGPAARPVATERAEPLLRLLVGAAFRRRREEQGRTLADVAAAARVSIAYLSEIERGRKEPSSEVLVAVCHALGMRLADLLTEAATELRTADLRRARRPVPVGARVRPVTAATTPTVVEVRSVTERADPAADDARRALLSVA